MSEPCEIRIGWAAKDTTPKPRVHGAHNWSNSIVNI